MMLRDAEDSAVCAVKNAGSVLASLSPAVKIVAAIFYSCGVCLLQTPRAAALACAFPLLLLPFSGLPATTAIKRLVPVNLFFLFLWVTLPVSFTPRPDTLFSFGPLRFHTSGLILAAAVTLKGNAVALALIALIDSSSAAANARALLRLRVPQKFVTLLLLTHANLTLMHREATRLFQAARLRGFSPRVSFASLRTYAWLLGMLLIRSWQRSKHVNDAMKLRSFAGIFPLLETGSPSLRPVAAAALIAFSIAVPGGMHLYENTGGFL